MIFNIPLFLFFPLSKKKRKEVGGKKWNLHQAITSSRKQLDHIQSATTLSGFHSDFKFALQIKFLLFKVFTHCMLKQDQGLLDIMNLAVYKQDVLR